MQLTGRTLASAVQLLLAGMTPLVGIAVFDSASVNRSGGDDAEMDRFSSSQRKGSAARSRANAAIAHAPPDRRADVVLGRPRSAGRRCIAHRRVFISIGARRRQRIHQAKRSRQPHAEHPPRNNRAARALISRGIVYDDSARVIVDLQFARVAISRDFAFYFDFPISAVSPKPKSTNYRVFAHHTNRLATSDLSH